LQRARAFDAQVVVLASRLMQVHDETPGARLTRAALRSALNGSVV
jgi:hypothetical protein